jgi:hypothetical protein
LSSNFGRTATGPKSRETSFKPASWCMQPNFRWLGKRVHNQFIK